MIATGAVVALALGAAQTGAPASPPPSAPVAVSPASPDPETAPASPSPANPPPANPPPANPPPASPADPLADDGAGVSVESAYLNAERHQGPLDGRWRLSDADGAALYDFQISDPAPGAATDGSVPAVEGAWRDLRRESPVNASGFLTEIRRDEAAVSLSWVEGAADQFVRLVLRRAADGGWSGELIRGGATIAVSLTRSGF